MDTYPVFFHNKIISKDKVTLHFTSPAVQYGIHVFEGISFLKVKNKRYLFRFKDHIDRLFRSCEKLDLEIENSYDTVLNSTLFYIKNINPKEDCNIRISIIPLEGSWSSSALRGKLLISAFPTSTQLLANKRENLSLKVTKIFKTSKESIDQSAKVGANYLNARYAQLESLRENFDSCLLTDQHHFISESAGSNIFLIKDNNLYTPCKKSNILHGITRDTIIKIAKFENIKVEECLINKKDLSKFNSAFLCGTSMKIKPVTQIDNLYFDPENNQYLKIKESYLNCLNNPGLYNKNWHLEV